MQLDKTGVVLAILLIVICVLSQSGEAFLREGRSSMDLEAFQKEKAYPNQRSRSSISHERNGYATDVTRGE